MAASLLSHQILPAGLRRPRSKVNSSQGKEQTVENIKATSDTTANGGESVVDAHLSSRSFLRTGKYRATETVRDWKTEIQHSRVQEDPVSRSSRQIVLRSLEAEQPSNSKETWEVTASDDEDQEACEDAGQDDEDSDGNDDPVKEEYFSAEELERPSPGRPYNLPKKRGDVIFDRDDHQKRYTKLKCRPFKPSRLCCPDTLETLGIHRDVIELLSRVHWVKFAFLSNKCYKDMTLEFLSSFHLQIDGDDQYPPYTFTFQLLNRRFVMRYEKFAEIFGFSYDGLERAHEDYNKHKFWSDIGGKGLFKAGRSKGWEIQNKALRYIHRFMSYSVQCRADSNTVVNKNELFFLWCMVNGCKVQTGKYFLRHLQDMANRPKGTIMIGAFVTHIALELNLYDPATYEPPTKVDSTDQNLTLLTLERIDMIKKVRGGYVFIDEGGIVAARSRKRQKIDESDDSIPNGTGEIARENIKTFAPHLGELAVAIVDQMAPRLLDTAFGVAGVDNMISSRLRQLDNAIDAVRQEIELVRNNVADLLNSLESL